MTEEEKEEIITMCNDIYEGGEWEPMINYIEKLKKELEYEKELRIRYERRYDLCKESKDKLQKENEKLKNEKEPAGEFFMSKNGVVIKVIDNREKRG